MEGHHAPCTMNREPPATSPTASARYQMSQQSERMPRQQTSQVTRERRKSHHSWTHSSPAWALNDKLSTLQLAWLSLILSLLQAVLWKVSLRKIPVSREDTFWIEQTSKDTSLLTLCEQLVFCVLKDGKSSVLLKY